MNKDHHTRLYRFLLRFYPPCFRIEFGDEMQQVFSDAVEEASMNGVTEVNGVYLRELRDLPAAAFRQHVREKSKQKPKFPILQGVYQGIATRKETLLALAAFLFPAVLVLLNSAPKPSPLIINLPTLIFMVAAFLFGVLKGLPRWSLPYLGILISLVGTFLLFNWISDIISPPVVAILGPGPWSESTRLLLQCFWAGLLWLGLFIFTLIVLGLLAILRHFSRLAQSIRQDWTLVSFVIYGEAIFALVLLFDEYHHEGHYIIASLLLLGGGAWFYLHSSTQWQRAMALFSGLSLAMWVAAYGQWLIAPLQAWPEWFEQHSPQPERWLGAVRTLLEWGWMVLILLTPALLRRIPRRGESRLL